MSPGSLPAQSKNSFGLVIQFISSMYVPSGKMTSLLRDDPPAIRQAGVSKNEKIVGCRKDADESTRG